MNLDIQDSDFGYCGRVVLKIDKLTIKSGERLGLVGTSGSGKTTFFAALSGTSNPLKGDLKFGGKVRHSAWRVKNVSRTLQAFPLFHWLTVEQNLSLACKIKSVPMSRVKQILNEFSAAHLADSYPRNLSGGERCRASIAQAVVGEPRLLLLDEPFNGLDPLVKEAAAKAMLQFASANDIALILVTHELRDAARYCNRILVLGGNRVSRIVADIPGNQTHTVDEIEAALKSHHDD